MIQTKQLKQRNGYLQKLIAFQDTEPVKVITGIRRCGKSSLLKLMIKHLKESGVSDEQIVSMNFESLELRRMNVDKLYHYVKDRVIPGKRLYIFCDEVQHIPAWEEAINSFRVDFDCDIYITGSNSYLLSSDYATYMSGRFVEIKMLPLSFSEFLDFHDFKLQEKPGILGGTHRQVLAPNGEVFDMRNAFDVYMRFGGMPGIEDVGFNQDKILTLLDGIYSTVVMRDILERERRNDQRPLNDATLLRKVVLFLADNIGSNVSVSSIGKTLAHEGLLEASGKTPSAHKLYTYVNALLESYFFYEIKRFDIKGKEFLRTLGKFYIVDMGLRNYLLGFRDRDTGHALENLVYLELLRRGYDVAIGKVDNTEIDFIATSAEEKLYIQVTASMLSPDVRSRELRPLQKIRDNYPKLVLSLDPGLDSSYESIQSLNVIDWLLAN